CVHLGSFFVWYDPELILKVFGRIRERIDNAHLLVVTEDVRRTHDYLQQALPADAFTVAAVPHRDVPALLAASDIGFLLLRSTPTCKLCSPANFSESVNGVLPFLIPPEVGVFPALVPQGGIGRIVTDEGVFDFSFLLNNVVPRRETLANHVMSVGR